MGLKLPLYYSVNAVPILHSELDMQQHRQSQWINSYPPQSSLPSEARLSNTAGEIRGSTCDYIDSQSPLLHGLHAPVVMGGRSIPTSQQDRRTRMFSTLIQ